MIFLASTADSSSRLLLLHLTLVRLLIKLLIIPSVEDLILLQVVSVCYSDIYNYG